MMIVFILIKWLRVILGSRIKTPIILQASETECGLSALAVILHYYKTCVSIETLRERCGASRDGMKAITLIETARSFGFEADAYSLSVDQLMQLNRPVILFWEGAHFVVLNRFTQHHVYINDPAVGERVITQSEFEQAYTKVTLIITPTRHSIKIKKEPVILPQMIAWVRMYRSPLLFISICLIFSIICSLLNASLMKVFFDYCLLGPHIEWLIYLACFGAIFTIIYGMSLRHQLGVQFKLALSASMKHTLEVISHVLRLPSLYYALNQKSALIVLIARLETTANLFFKSITAMLTDFLAIIISLFFMAKINFRLFSLSLACSLVSFSLIFLVTKFIFLYETTNQHFLGKYYTATHNAMRHLETIKASGFEENAYQTWLDTFNHKRVYQHVTDHFSLIIESLNKGIEYGVMVFIFILGGKAIQQGELTIGLLMAYYTLHLFYVGKVTQFFHSAKSFQNACASYLRANHLLKRKKDTRFHAEKRSAMPIADKPLMTVKKLNFYYNKTADPTLNNIDFTLRSGEQIAFVGATGSGKSTFAKILAGLLWSTSGTVKLNGCDIENHSHDALARSIAYVSQEVTLFSGTIYDNLTMWRTDVSTDALNHAIRIACLEDVISERGLHGLVSENGSNFSGGERQRIEIARAIIQGTEILILDEATSALDVVIEEKIISHLRKLNQTIIYVAHRLSTISHCDQICVFRKGEIIERGNHKTLIHLAGYYYSLIHHTQMAAA